VPPALTDAVIVVVSDVISESKLQRIRVGCFRSSSFRRATDNSERLARFVVSASCGNACKTICILLETRLIFGSRGSNKNSQTSKLSANI